jgi:enoyl-CoA hydratase/carnithine racemase
MTDGNANDTVLREDRDGIATLTLNRPDKRNALNVDLFMALDRHLADIEQATDSVGAVVLRAAGSLFCAGADLGKQQKPPVKHFQARTIGRLAELPQPVIAAVHAPCYTGGLELVLGADIIIAAEGARFADTHGKWALTPGWGMSARLPRRIGTHRARLMMFSGRLIDARTAEAWGLVDLCVADDVFETAVAELAAEIAANSWHSNRGNKGLLNDSGDLSLGSALAWELAHTPGAGPDFNERVGGRFGPR